MGLAPRPLQLWGGPASTGHKPASAYRKPVPRQCQRDVRHRARLDDGVGPTSGCRANAGRTQYWPCWAVRSAEAGPVVAYEQEGQTGTPVHLTQAVHLPGQRPRDHCAALTSHIRMLVWAVGPNSLLLEDGCQVTHIEQSS